MTDSLNNAMDIILPLMGYKRLQTYWYKPIAFSCMLYSSEEFTLSRLKLHGGAIVATHIENLSTKDLKDASTALHFVKLFESGLIHSTLDDMQLVDEKLYELEDMKISLFA